MKALRLKIQDEMSLQQAPMYVIEKDYALSYVLAGIARESKLSHSLIFKGGTALKKLFFWDYRFSDFEENAKSPNHKNRARGLLQITEETLHILNDHKGELSNYLMFIRAQDLFDPSVNICSGVRWLFRKQITASARLGRNATWEEAVIEYKSYWDEINAKRIPNGIIRLREYYEKLEGK